MKTNLQKAQEWIKENFSVASKYGIAVLAFARFLDQEQEKSKECGIPTPTPDEIEEMGAPSLARAMRKVATPIPVPEELNEVELINRGNTALMAGMLCKLNELIRYLKSRE